VGGDSDDNEKVTIMIQMNYPFSKFVCTRGVNSSLSGACLVGELLIFTTEFKLCWLGKLSILSPPYARAFTHHSDGEEGMKEWLGT
jgi:hypothetical protein